MMPGYSKFTKAIALKQVLRPLDIPAVSLGTSPFELLNPVRNGRPVLSEPRMDVKTGGVVAGQSYEGTSGWGSLIPDITPGDIPYYGPDTGGE